MPPSHQRLHSLILALLMQRTLASATMLSHEVVQQQQLLQHDQRNLRQGNNNNSNSNSNNINNNDSRIRRRDQEGGTAASTTGNTTAQETLPADGDDPQAAAVSEEAVAAGTGTTISPAAAAAAGSATTLSSAAGSAAAAAAQTGVTSANPNPASTASTAAAAAADLQSINRHIGPCPGYETKLVEGYSDLEGLRKDLIAYFNLVNPPPPPPPTASGFDGFDAMGGVGGEMGGGVDGTICPSDTLPCSDGSFASRNPSMNCVFDMCADGSMPGSSGVGDGDGNGVVGGGGGVDSFPASYGSSSSSTGPTDMGWGTGGTGMGGGGTGFDGGGMGMGTGGGTGPTMNSFFGSSSSSMATGSVFATMPTFSGGDDTADGVGGGVGGMTGDAMGVDGMGGGGGGDGTSSTTSSSMGGMVRKRSRTHNNDGGDGTGNINTKRHLQEVGLGGDTAATITSAEGMTATSGGVMEGDGAVAGRSTPVPVMAAYGSEQGDGDGGSGSGGGGGAGMTGSVVDSAQGGTEGMEGQESSASSNTNTDASTANGPIQEGKPIIFDICPNTNFDFNDLLATSTTGTTGGGGGEVLSPLVFHTPTKNPIWINCRKDLMSNNGDGDDDSSEACVFQGGKIHLVFDNHGIQEEVEMENVDGGMSNGTTPGMTTDTATITDPILSGEEGAGAGEAGAATLEGATRAIGDNTHPITFMGITFRGATETSVLMNDPRGTILFEDCAWKNNVGTSTIKIDGKYDSSNVIDAAVEEWWTTPIESDVVGTNGNDAMGGGFGTFSTAAATVFPPIPTMPTIPGFGDLGTPISGFGDGSDGAAMQFPTLPPSPTISPKPTEFAGVIGVIGDGTGMNGPTFSSSSVSPNMSPTFPNAGVGGTDMNGRTTPLPFDAIMNGRTTARAAFDAMSGRSTGVPGTMGPPFDEMTGGTLSPPLDGMTGGTLSPPLDGMTGGTMGPPFGGMGTMPTTAGFAETTLPGSSDVAPTLPDGVTSTLGPSSALFADTSSTTTSSFLWTSEMTTSMPNEVPNGMTTSVPNMKRELSRSLVVGTVPSSMITMKKCLFSGNIGSASIMVSSHSDNLSRAQQDPGTLTQSDDLFTAEPEVRQGSTSGPLAHSIHLALEDTTFAAEVSETAVIVIDGGRLQTADCKFLNNVAKTVIDSESGTLAMSSTEFSYNVVSDDLGYVELGVGSTLEANDNNCDKSTSGGASSDGTVSDTSTGTFVSARQGLISTVTGDDATPAITTEGSDVTIGNSTDDSNVTSVSTTEGGNVTSASLTEGDVAQVSSKCIGISANGICVEQFGASCAAEGGGLEGCFSNWDELVNAVRDRSQTDPDFMICPNTTLEVGDNPVMIDSDYTTIKCGADGLRSDNCVISKGFSHFHITGSPADVELLGLTMEASWGSSIIAAGTSESTLRLNDCGWNLNAGSSAVVIRDSSVSEFNQNVTLLMESAGPAMSIELRNSEFVENVLSFGTIANIGGALTVYKTLFEMNAAVAGDIVVTNNGTCKLQENCFTSHSSGAPGTVFVEEGSTLGTNTDNFGASNAAGSFAGGPCNAIFEETGGTNCLGGAGCNGYCKEFESTTCPLEGITTANAAAPRPVVMPQEVESKSNLVPIVVATVVSAFVVFGMAFIIIRRKKGKSRRSGETEAFTPNRSSGGSKIGNLFSAIGSACASIPGRFKKKKSHDTSAYDVEVDDDNI